MFCNFKQKRDDKEHLKIVRELPCLNCGLKSEPHHLLYVPREIYKGIYGFQFLRGGKLTAPDMFSVPFCRTHHNRIHDVIGTDKFYPHLPELAIEINEHKEDYEYCLNAINRWRNGQKNIHNHE